MTTAAVVLAAGGGSRFIGTTHKLLAPFDGSTVVACAIAHALAAGMHETIVVSGAVDLAPAPDGVTLVHNPRWSEGIATSLALAVEVARTHGHEAIVVGLGDQPRVDPAAWQAVAVGECPIVVATYAGQRGNPVRIVSDVWTLLPSTGDEGARAVMRSNPDLVCELACPGDPGDIDTVEDLERWT